MKRLGDLLSDTSARSIPGALRIAVVAGAGGLGKTSLAVHVAHRTRGSFPDGQLYVDLLGATPDPLLPEDILARLLRDLGVDGRDIPVDTAERIARYRSTLAGRRMLVLLDNARDAAQVRPLLPGTASSAVLVTTRSRMPDLASAELIDLHELDDDEALRLFTKIVGQERAGAEPEATAELLEACAGLPLAIRIGAARLAARSGWTIRAVADRLRDQHRRLDELRAGDLAVRASLQVSFASLPANADKQGIDPARAFRLLSLWQGSSVSSVAAAALFGVPESPAEDALEILVDAHLLDAVAPSRYRLHDLLRVYAAEWARADLAAEERETAGRRLLEWYMRTADAAATAVMPHRYDIPLAPAEVGQQPGFADAEDAFAWYDSERGNIVAATRQAAATGLDEIAWRLPAPLFVVFTSRGNWSDLIATHRIALDSARRTGNRQGEAWVLSNLGDALGVTGDSEGITLLERSLEIRREIGDHRGEAQSANNLADALQQLGRTDEALALLHRALQLNRDAGYQYAEGIALGNLGSTLLDLGQAADAISYLQQAREAFAATGYTDGAGYMLHILGRCYSSLGRDVEALESLRQALASHQAADNRHGQAVTLRSLATAQDRLSLVIEARASRALAADIFDDLGETVPAAEVRSELSDPANRRHNSSHEVPIGRNQILSSRGPQVESVSYITSARCNCEPPREIQLPRTKYEDGPIICGICSERFVSFGQLGQGITQVRLSGPFSQSGPVNIGMPRFRILGPIGFWTGQDWQIIGAPKWRSVLAELVLNPGQIVPTPDLIHAVFGEQPPARAANLISIYTLRLRRLMGDVGSQLLQSSPAGYQLRIEPADVDARRFEDLVKEGRNSLNRSEPDRAASLLTEALVLWHGEPLADVPHSAAVIAEAEHLNALRRIAEELHKEAQATVNKT